MHICINPTISQSYLLGDNIIPTRSTQSDLGMDICGNLQWSDHNSILSKTYEILGLVHHTFCDGASILTKTTLYISA